MRDVSTELPPITQRSSELDAGLYFADDALNVVVVLCHGVAIERNWWHDANGKPVVRNLGECLALIHSEISEGLEAARKDLPSDHIEGFSGLEEELADAVIRICDLAGALQLRLGAALTAKLAFNRTRTDHALSARISGGKQF